MAKSQLRLEQVADVLEQIYGIILLEHHNKGYLNGDNATRSQAKLALIQEALDRLGLFRRYDIFA